MINFVEYLYANNVFYYRRTERYGERVSASVTVFSYTLGFCIIALNFLQLFTGSLAPFVRQAAPAFNKPYNNAAEYVLIVPVALLVHYLWLWQRTSTILTQHKQLKTESSRWLAPVSFLSSGLFAVACGYGRVNFGASLLAVALLLASHQVMYICLKRRGERATEA